MSRYNYLYSSVLNFGETCLRQRDITKDAIGSGRTVLNDLVHELDEQWVKDRRTQTTSDVFMYDIYELLQGALNIPDFMALFTIWKIGEVRRILHDVLTTMTLSVNKCTDKIEDLIEQCKASLLESPAWPKLVHTKPEIPFFTSNLPTECLESFSKQKDFVERNGGSGIVLKIIQRQGGLIAYVELKILGMVEWDVES